MGKTLETNSPIPPATLDVLYETSVSSDLIRHLVCQVVVRFDDFTRRSAIQNIESHLAAGLI